MLQSRLRAAIVGKRTSLGANWAWIKRGFSEEGSPSQGSGDTQGYAPMPTGRAADPAMHSSEPPGKGADGSDPTAHIEAETLVQPKSPIASSPKLEHTEVGNPSKPNTYHKRPFSNSPSQQALQDITCAGLDGSPWPDDAEGQEAQKRAQEQDNKDYFKDHKASPLSELEFADSRKPISQVTDHSPSGGSTGVLLFDEDQLDTAEGSLMRAVEIWQWNKMRGDPDSPHGRALRALRGESW